MKVRTRLTIIVVAVALAPLLLSGVLGMQVHQRAFEEKLSELHASRAATGAAKAQAFFDRAVEDLRLMVTQTIHWSELSEREREGALALVYEQDPDLAMATLLDEHGAGIGDAVFRQPEHDLSHLGHPVATMEALSAFSLKIPFAAAQQKGSAFGAAFFDGNGDPIVPLALRTAGAGGAEWTVAVGLSLRSLCKKLDTDRGGQSQILLVDEHGETLCGPRSQADAAMLLTARTPLGNGWQVVSQEPRSTAFAASRALRRQNIWLILASLILALVLGLVLARRITRPLFVLTANAAELGRGELPSMARRLRIPPDDEFGQLHAAFDHMASEIQRREGEILQFNAELQRRVDERTAELRSMQAELLQSQKIAAVTSLGAGIAHEINNPLTCVLGFAQILRARSARENRPDDVQVLDLVEGEAQRIKRIVQTLLTFTQGYGGEQFTELDLNEVCHKAIAQVAGTEVQIVPQLDSALPRVLGNSEQLQEALAQLLKNAMTAMKGEGAVTLRTVAADGLVKLEVTDTGAGIAPEHLAKIFDPFFTTKAEWSGEGLGLTLVHRIVEQHHGRVVAKSELGHGSTFTLSLPSGSRRAHLC